MQSLSPVLGRIFPFSNFPSPQQINREKFSKIFSPRVTVATWKKKRVTSKPHQKHTFSVMACMLLIKVATPQAPSVIITSHRHRNILGTKVKRETNLQHLAELKENNLTIKNNWKVIARQVTTFSRKKTFSFSWSNLKTKSVYSTPEW